MPKKRTSGEIFMNLKKLNVVGSVLHVAAHPDDENTTLISYLSNQKHLYTTYLSMTRGDGGQNLIGPEIRELLGIIRTQELLAARRLDGGNQMFTRANDFGYSKNPFETFDMWDRDKVLSDVVWAIRKARPDIIINRFKSDPNQRNHGHHTGSAMLSVEAFNLAGDRNAYPEQLKYVEPWQPKAIYLNTSWFFYGSREKFAKADKSNMAAVDLGVYYPLLGKSNTEISALSRSMHKCQGFGVIGSRGTDIGYFEFVSGQKHKEEFLDQVDFSWNRLAGGEEVSELIEEAIDNYDFSAPYTIVPLLMKIKRKIGEIEDNHWNKIKMQEVDQLVIDCMGLYVEAVSSERILTPGENSEVYVELTNRSPIDLQIKSLIVLPTMEDSLINKGITGNERVRVTLPLNIDEKAKYSNQYWLNEKAEIGSYTVKNQSLIGLPETPREYRVSFDLEVDGIPFSFSRPIVFKRRDPVAGEVFQPMEILPKVFVSIEDKVIIFDSEEERTVGVQIKSGAEKVSGELVMCHPKGWKIEPDTASFDLSQKGEVQRLEFRIIPPKGQAEGFISPLAIIEGDVYEKELVEIKYDHIPIQSVLRHSESKVVKLDLQKAGKNVGYVHGAGDDIPASLRQIGYEVDIVDPDQINVSTLSKYDAVILGVRALNTVEALRFKMQDILKYVHSGGNLIIQYNTSGSKVTNDFSPYPLNLSRDRVSMEDAPVKILEPDHSIMTWPNKISQNDFDGWVQERGLYFANEWDDNFTAILSSHDKGESPKDGGLLVAKYGEGNYIYTGYSWFRELPAGVSGAFRIFANMISIGKDTRP
jgi:LmbE family N-acetylglucosaminyl deacetylase